MGRIALIAHDRKKDELLELVHDHVLVLRPEHIVTTESTGRLVAERFGLEVEQMASGPHGGDLQIGALVASAGVKLVVFLRDPLAAHPHEPDIQALMKICDVHRIPLATNAATAELCFAALGRNDLRRAA
jgi:methylglyoxal synthase